MRFKVGEIAVSIDPTTLVNKVQFVSENEYRVISGKSDYIGVCFQGGPMAFERLMYWIPDETTKVERILKCYEELVPTAEL